MKWQIVDKKHNVGKGTIQEYNIELETTQTNNLLEVNVKVNHCPRRQRPVTWNTSDVTKWLNDKGIIVEGSVNTPILQDIGDCTAVFTFKMKKQTTNTNKISKKKTKRKTTVTTATNAKSTHLNTEEE